MLPIDKGSVEDVYQRITDQIYGDSVDISSAVYQVYNSSDVSVQAQANCAIIDNNTASPVIAGEVNTTTSGFIACNTYYVLFTVIIAGKTLIYKRTFKVI